MLNPQQEDHEKWKINLRSKLITCLTGNTEEKDKATEQVGYYYMCYAPTYLYKYYSDTPENIDAVLNNKMWYSAPCKFNDVFDSDICIDEDGIFDCAIKLIPDKRGLRKGSFMWQQLKQTMNKEIQSLKLAFDDMKYTTGISCLSESNDSLLMWAHYANNHCGMCVEYELLELNKQLDFTPIPIIYTEGRAHFNSLNQDTIEDDTTKVFIESLTSKSPEWSYEREWRIIRDSGACGKKWDSEKKGALLNVVRPASIFLGCMVKPDFEKEIRKYCETNQINLYKMSKDRDLYRLNKIQLLQYTNNTT